MYFLLALQSWQTCNLGAAWSPLYPSLSTSSPRPRIFSESAHYSAGGSLTPGGSTGDQEPTHSDAPESKKRHTVTWQTQATTTTPENVYSPNNNNDETISFDIYDGETLRTAALRRNVVSPHNGRANLINCRGLGTCGTCAVEIDGRVEPPERSRIETARLNFPPHNFHNNEKLRLACQIVPRGDIHVVKRTGFWGQKEDVAAPSTPQRYFGDLEYVLDNKSPEDPGSESTQ